MCLTTYGICMGTQLLAPEGNKMGGLERKYSVGNIPTEIMSLGCKNKLESLGHVERLDVQFSVISSLPEQTSTPRLCQRTTNSTVKSLKNKNHGTYMLLHNGCDAQAEVFTDL